MRHLIRNLSGFALATLLTSAGAAVAAPATPTEVPSASGTPALEPPRHSINGVLSSHWHQKLADVEKQVPKTWRLIEKAKDKLVFEGQQFGSNRCKAVLAFRESDELFRLTLIVPIEGEQQVSERFAQVIDELNRRLNEPYNWQYYEGNELLAERDSEPEYTAERISRVNSGVGRFASYWMVGNSLVLLDTSKANTEIEVPYLWLMAEYTGFHPPYETEVIEDLLR